MPYKVLEYRLERHLTQEELAEKSGVSRSWIWKIENGFAKAVSVKIIKALADALEVSIDDLFLAEDVSN